MHFYFNSDSGKAPRPERREGHWRVTLDESGNPVLIQESEDCSSTSAEGSVDSAHTLFDSFFHCGHPRTQPLGSKCSVDRCHRLSCATCSKRCLRCFQPLCLEHTKTLVVEGQSLTYCPSCFNRVRRQRFWHAITAPIVRFFVDADKRSAQ